LGKSGAIALAARDQLAASELVREDRLELRRAAVAHDRPFHPQVGLAPVELERRDLVVERRSVLDAPADVRRRKADRPAERPQTAW
jgi:hypothetical protein